MWRELLLRCDASRLLERHLNGFELGAADAAPLLLALGKAAGPLLEGAAQLLPATALSGALAVTGAEGGLPPGVESVIGDHPLPGKASLAAGDRVAAWADLARKGDRPVWVLLSGGASSLLELPRPGVSFEELLAVHQRLLEAGVPIAEQNAARARLSALKGGGLASRLGEALGRVLVLVDIPGGEPELVGSGPCSPGPVELEVLATPEALVREAATLLREAGVPIHPLSGARPGLDGLELAAELSTHLRRGEGALLVAGEAGFDRRGREAEGRGGRAAHLALEVLERMDGVTRPWICLAGASDGRDGAGEGGAVVSTGHPASPAERRAALEGFASADFHRRFDSALSGSVARTNLCDLYLAWC